MQTPHFVTLVQIDRRHFIAACRHGIVHLNWERATIRLREDEFRRLAALVEKAALDSPPAPLRDGQLRVTSRLEEDSEIGFGSLVLLLEPAEWQAFSRAMPAAIQRLDELRSSGAWEQPGQPEPPPDPLEPLRRTRFSDN